MSELQLGLNDYIIGVEWEYVDLTFHYSTSLHIFFVKVIQTTCGNLYVILNLIATQSPSIKH